MQPTTEELKKAEKQKRAEESRGQETYQAEWFDKTIKHFTKSMNCFKIIRALHTKTEQLGITKEFTEVRSTLLITYSCVTGRESKQQ